MRHVVATYLLVFLAKMLAAGGGLGGGGLLVPIFLLVSAVAPSSATPLSVCAIAGGAVANYLAYSQRRRSDNAPLVDYSAALLVLPPLLMGTMLGAVLDAVLPEWLIVCLLFCVLSALAVRTTHKGLSTWRAQGRALAAEAARLECERSSGDVVERSRENSDHSQRRSRSNSPLPPLFPRHALGYAGASWTVVLLSALARGGHGAPSVLKGGVTCGSALYWCLFLLAWAALAGLTISVRDNLLLAAPSECDAADEGECDDAATMRLLVPPRWTCARTRHVPLASFGAGVAAGVLGIGGGMLVGPLLLELGVEPRGVAATGAFLVLLADTSVVTQYALMGLLPASHGAPLALTAFAATAVGQAAAERVIVVTGRTAVVMLIIAAVIAVSTLATGAVAVRNLVAAARQGTHMGMRSLCS